MRKSNLYFIYIVVHVALLGLVFTHAGFKKETNTIFLNQNMNMVEMLTLTDLCIFTEASYTRHLSQADFHAAFQDSPMALEHFPSGSFVKPPPFTKKVYEKVD